MDRSLNLRSRRHGARKPRPASASSRRRFIQSTGQSFIRRSRQVSRPSTFSSSHTCPRQWIPELWWTRFPLGTECGRGEIALLEGICQSDDERPSLNIVPHLSSIQPIVHSRSFAVAFCSLTSNHRGGTGTHRPGVWKPQQHLSAHIRAHASLCLWRRGACDVCPGP